MAKILNSRIQIFGKVSKIGDDLLIHIEGGKSHIGAVAMAEIISGKCEVSVLTAKGHKETELSKFAAQQFAEATQRRTLAIVGIHQDNITKTEIAEIEKNVESLVEQFISDFS